MIGTKRLSSSSASQRGNWGPLLIEPLETISPEQTSKLFTKMEISTMIDYTPESEMKLITLLFNKSITLDRFCSRLTNIQSNCILREELISAVKSLFESDCYHLETTIACVYEACVAGIASTGSLKLVKRALKKVNTVICWNAAILDKTYVDTIMKVLCMAEKYRRVVRFVRWSHEIPITSLRELFKQNILCYLRTGHYWPTEHVYFSYRYVDSLVKLKRDAIEHPLRMTHTSLAAQFHYHMNEHGFVVNATESSKAISSAADRHHQDQLASINEAFKPPSTKLRSFAALLTSTQTFLQPFSSVSITTSDGGAAVLPSSATTDVVTVSQKHSSLATNTVPASYPWIQWTGDNTVIECISRMGGSGSDLDHWRNLYGFNEPESSISSSSASNDTYDSSRPNIYYPSWSMDSNEQRNKGYYGSRVDDIEEVEHKEDSLTLSPMIKQYTKESTQKLKLLASHELHDEDDAYSPFLFLNTSPNHADIGVRPASFLVSSRVPQVAHAPTTTSTANPIVIATEMDGISQHQVPDTLPLHNVTSHRPMIYEAPPALSSSALSSASSSSSNLRMMQKPLLRLENPNDEQFALPRAQKPATFLPSWWRNCCCCMMVGEEDEIAKTNIA